MKKQSINQDQFLKSQGVEIERSDFLQRLLNRKEKGVKQEYNLLDLHGRRLGRYWQPGDTALSVIKKKIKNNIYTIFDPDTYTRQSLQEARERIVRQKVKILGFVICLAFPYIFYNQFLSPRIKRAKRMYLMQFYNKMGFFSKELGVKTKPISPQDLKKIL